jgi:hypothetical protein
MIIGEISMPLSVVCGGSDQPAFDPEVAGHPGIDPALADPSPVPVPFDRAGRQIAFY